MTLNDLSTRFKVFVADLRKIYVCTYLIFTVLYSIFVDTSIATSMKENKQLLQLLWNLQQYCMVSLWQHSFLVLPIYSMQERQICQ